MPQAMLPLLIDVVICQVSSGAVCLPPVAFSHALISAINALDMMKTLITDGDCGI